jgi:hypothetical protein
MHRAARLNLECGWKPGRTDLRDGAEGSIAVISRRQQGSGTPPFPFPPPGESRGGRVPPTPASTLPASKKRWQASCAGSPHKRAAAPLCIPCERGTQGLAMCETPEERQARVYLTGRGLLMEAVTKGSGGFSNFVYGPAA